MTSASPTAEPQPAPEVEPIDFRASGRFRDEEVDMTPMVDVVFLLLIFFMVTAAFSLQKAKETPTPEKKEQAASKTLQEIEEDDDYVIVEIRGDNTVFVDDVEAPSKHDLIVKLREARQGTPGSRGPSSLLVLADRECHHAALVMALDAGNAAGMENIRWSTAEEGEF